MELAGLILVGIGVNTFINGVWLLLYNNQTKLIEKNYLEHSDKIKNIENSINKIFKQGEK
jgi:hypothetical protein